MHTTFRLSVFLLFIVQLFCSCTSDSLPEPDSTQPETPAGIPDAYQDKIRTQPYPKADNELYLNPAPLIVPQAMKTGERLQFSLSRTEDFSSSETLLSEPQEWCMYNLHRRLEVGTWYWRFRSTNLNGTTPGEWSAIYRFELKNDTPEFVTPPFQTFLANAPRLHPRIYCFLDDRIGEARNRVTSHPEYADEAYRIATTLLEGKDPKTNEANNFNTAFTPVSQTVAVKDRVFFCEELFALHNMKRTTMYKELFSSDLEDDNILLSTESYINKLYDEPNDYRKHSWEVATGRQTSGLMVFVKYAEQTENRSDPYLYEIQSMLRLSELYLIAAATTNDDAVASSWLEKLRMIRGYQSGMVGSDVQTTLRQEWEKEFYGEGQYYYYLKCNGITSVSGPNGSKKPNYIIPLPESETDNRRD